MAENRELQFHHAGSGLITIFSYFINCNYIQGLPIDYFNCLSLFCTIFIYQKNTLHRVSILTAPDDFFPHRKKLRKNEMPKTIPGYNSDV